MPDEEEESLSDEEEDKDLNKFDINKDEEMGDKEGLSKF